MNRDRATFFMLANSPMLRESIIYNQQRNGSRLLMPAFIAAVVAGIVWALVW